MKRVCSAGGISLFLILLLACEKQSLAPQRLGLQVRFVPAAEDTAVVEAGIDAVPESDAIQLHWRRGNGLTEYRLYRRKQEETTFTLIVVLSERDSLFLDQVEVALHVRYHYYLLGADAAGAVPQPSDTVDYMLLPKVLNLAQAFQQDTLRFHWQPAPQSPAEYYLLKLFDDADGRLIWMSRLPGYQSDQEMVRYNWDGAAKLERLTHKRVYRWRVDAVGAALHSGSESPWRKFSIP